MSIYFFHRRGPDPMSTETQDRAPTPEDALNAAREPFVALLDQVRHSGCSCGLCGATTAIRVEKLDALLALSRAAGKAEADAEWRERVEASLASCDTPDCKTCRTLKRLLAALSRLVAPDAGGTP